jgi:hypothetical protein
VSKRIVIIGLLVIGAVAIMRTEAAAWSYCFGCLSGDKCQLDFKTGGLYTGNQLNNGDVSTDCNNKNEEEGAKILAANIICRNQGGTVAPGFPVQGNATATFDIEQTLTPADVHGSAATKQLPIETTFAEFCSNPPPNLATDFPQCSGVCDGTPAACNAFSSPPSSCYTCYKNFFGLPAESFGCPNSKWRYDSIDYNDHCVNFRVFVAGFEEISVTRRCTDPGNINFVECVEDPICLPLP